MPNRHQGEPTFHGMHPMDDREAIFYTLQNSNDFRPAHLDTARDILGLVDVKRPESHGLIDGQFVLGDVSNPTHRGEVLVDHRLTKEELEKLGKMGLSAKEGEAPRAA